MRYMAELKKMLENECENNVEEVHVKTTPKRNDNEAGSDEIGGEVNGDEHSIHDDDVLNLVPEHEDRVEPKRLKMCRYGQLCNRKTECDRSHVIVQKQCRFGQNCTKGGKCLFLHSRERSSEMRGPHGSVVDNCYIKFNNNLASMAGYANQAMIENDPNRRPVVPGQNLQRNETHASKRICRDGLGCTTPDCPLLGHEPVLKTCRFGNKCNKNGKCPFQHGETATVLQCGESNICSYGCEDSQKTELARSRPA